MDGCSDWGYVSRQETRSMPEIIVFWAEEYIFVGDIGKRIYYNPISLMWRARHLCLIPARLAQYRLLSLLKLVPDGPDCYDGCRKGELRCREPLPEMYSDINSGSRAS
ncbi:hypothetical protein J6590_042023 [Homalodisca vitripennis]|nr:hypothetical protein J6590_042023 [Homalodisca vitripennis]